MKGINFAARFLPDDARLGLLTACFLACLSVSGGALAVLFTSPGQSALTVAKPEVPRLTDHDREVQDCAGKDATATYGFLLSFCREEAEHAYKVELWWWRATWIGLPILATILGGSLAVISFRRMVRSLRSARLGTMGYQAHEPARANEPEQDGVPLTHPPPIAVDPPSGSGSPKAETMSDPISAGALRAQYEKTSDEELLDLMAQGETTYTEVAWAVLQEEVSRRHLVAKIEPSGPSDTPGMEFGLDRFWSLGKRGETFAVIGVIGLFISVWRMLSGDIGGAVFGLGIGLYFWYNVLLKPRGPKGK